MEATGICRSDWHGWQGHDPDIVSLLHVPGHELAGRVVAVGAEVRRWRGGERVTTPFVCGCDDCVSCGRGDHQVCDHQTLGARVIAIDTDRATLVRAQALGAEAVIHGGADVSIDALGSAVTAANSIACLRKNGRHVRVGLLVGPDHRPPLPMELVIARELEIIGSHGMAAHAYPRMLAMIANGHPQRWCPVP